MSDENKTPEKTPTTAAPASALEIGKTTAAPSPRKLTAGRDVLYRAKAGHQGLVAGQKYPAKVVEAHGDLCATLAVFSTSEQYPLHVIKSVGIGTDPGTWAWPELV